MKPMSLRIAERKMRKPPSRAERARLSPMARLVLEIFEKAAAKARKTCLSIRSRNALTRKWKPAIARSGGNQNTNNQAYACVPASRISSSLLRRIRRFFHQWPMAFAMS
jgi:hypothetical protein